MHYPLVSIVSVRRTAVRKNGSPVSMLLILLCGSILPAVGKQARQPIVEEVAQRDEAPLNKRFKDSKLVYNPKYPHNWSLRLDSVQLSSKGISKISATLHNLSNKNVRFNRSLATSGLFYGARIWTSDTSGSYRMRLNPNIIVDPSRKMIELRAGETVRLVWLSPEVREDPPHEELVHHRRYSALPVECTKKDLSLGECIVDSKMELTLWETPANGTHKRLGMVTIFADNKIWVSVDE